VKRLRLILVLIFIAIACAVFLSWRELQREKKYFPQIQAAAQHFKMDPLLVKAVVWRESKFRPNIRGKAGEIGLMQIQEIAAMEWAEAEHIENFQHEQCFDPGTNTLAGTFYLSKLMKRYTNTDNPVPYALADYNAGRGNILKWNKGAAGTNSSVFISQIGFPGTKNYVKTIERRYAFYRFLARIGLQ
jgi:soluble lytic murein transglycosylase